jgi:hypothetical protein
LESFANAAVGVPPDIEMLERPVGRLLPAAD